MLKLVIALLFTVFYFQYVLRGGELSNSTKIVLLSKGRHSGRKISAMLGINLPSSGPVTTGFNDLGLSQPCIKPQPPTCEYNNGRK